MTLLTKCFSSPYFYLVGWLIINLFQGYFSLLGDDEAYYWFCSQELDAGYFHQPPGVMWVSRLGYWLLPNELGVRLFIILGSVFTHFFLWKIVEPTNVKLYFIVAFSSILVHFGFYVAPDGVMLFFASAFLLTLKHYIKKDSWWLAILLAVLAAAVAYSKYHGALIIVPAILINLKLAKRASFWLIPVLGILLYIPHIQWQITHEFITFNFHLNERTPGGVGWYSPFHYLGSLILIQGPLISGILFIGFFKTKSKNQFERTLKAVFYTVFGFFLCFSFSTIIEANWTASLLFPLIYFGYLFAEKRPVARRWTYGIGILSLLLMGAFRVWVVYDFTPAEFKARKEFHGIDVWAQEIKELADGRPVVFANSYQMASKYSFYSGEEGHSLSSINHSGNQFILMTEKEESLQGKDILFATEWQPNAKIFVHENGDTLRYNILPNFRNYNRLKLELTNLKNEYEASQEIELEFNLINTTTNAVLFNESPNFRPKVMVMIMNGNEVVHTEVAANVVPGEQLNPGDTISLRLPVHLPDVSGKFILRQGIQSGKWLKESNGLAHQINIKPK